MSEPLRPGAVLGGRYQLEDELARGGMGTVWRAQDPLLSRTVAVKVLDPALGVDQQVRARFRREAVAAAAVTHPNIVATYDTGDDGDVAYIVMELVEGRTLRHIIDEEAPLPVPRAADITWQIADALAVAHSRSLVHRDIKPSNVLVQPDGRVRVTDFGIAKAADSTESELTRSGMVVGTARYLAPEQVDGREVDSRADVYSLGLVLYEMLVGEPPFVGDTDIATAVARLTGDPVSVRTRRPDVPAGVADVVERALARDRASRLPSAVALRDAIEPFRRGGTAVGAPAAPPPRADATVPVQIPARPVPRGVTNDPTRTSLMPRRARRGPVALLWIAAFVLGALAGWFGWQAASGEETTTPSTTAAVVAPLPIAAVFDFDPLGTGGENPEQVDAVRDGDTATVWSTERYTTRNVGGKDGVGIVLDLGREAQVEAVDVQAVEGGWSGAVFAGTTAADDVAGWGAPRAVGTDLAPTARLALSPPGPARYVLVWITNLPESRRLELAEVQVLGRS